MQSLEKNGYFIDGKWLEKTNRTYPVYNPATGEVITNIASCGTEETQQAIASSEKAFKAWKKVLPAERGRLIRLWGQLMLQHQDELATILVREQGKPFAEAIGEVAYAASFLEWFADEARRTYGDVVPTFKADARVIVSKEPVGVTAAITPWNFPLAMITRKVGPALAAGCTMILKPSEETPMSAFALAALGEKAGIPSGVLNVVSGDAVAIGKAIQDSSNVRKISFTGSTKTGKLLMSQASGTLKRLSLELGGNAPFIVFEDADINAAVKGAMASKFRNTGQTCVCVNRFFIHENVYDEFTRLLHEEVKKMRIGNGLTGETEQGPLINKMAFEKVETHVKDAIAKGAKVLCGAKPHSLGGTFYEPTILTEMTDDMLVAQEETFGPVAACFRFKDEEEVLQRANNTQAGLSSYFYTKDYARVWRVAEQLETGIIGINEGIISTAVAPFGGVKESGFGREGAKTGIDEYVQQKYMLMGGL